MILVDIDGYILYSGVHADDTTLLESFVNSAEEIVLNYLEYTPTEDDYTHYFSTPVATNIIKLRAKPITEITSVTIDGVSYDTDLFLADNGWLTVLNGDKLFTVGSNNIQVAYTAGYTAVPEMIKTTIYQIAESLRSDREFHMQNEITTPTGTRKWIGSVNFDKTLNKIAHYSLKDIF